MSTDISVDITHSKQDPMWVFSCFPYENANGHLKGLVHGTFDTLPQRFVAQIFVLIYSFFITVSIGGGIMGVSYI